MLGHGSGDELRELFVASFEPWSILIRFTLGSSSESTCKWSVLLRFSRREGIVCDDGGDGAARVSYSSKSWTWANLAFLRGRGASLLNFRLDMLLIN